MRFIVFVFLVISVIDLKAQCPDHNLEFYNQEELNAFIKEYPNCTEIEGNVKILGLGSDIMDLSSLNGIKYIRGDLRLGYLEQIKDLKYFNNLIEVDGKITIDHNNSLTKISGFKNLKSVDKLRYANNSNLDSLYSLPKIETVNAIEIVSNNSNSILFIPEIDTINEIITFGNLFVESTNSQTNIQLLSIYRNDNYSKLSDLSQHIENDIKQLVFSETDSFSLQGLNNVRSIKELVLADIPNLDLGEDNSFASPLSLSIFRCEGFVDFNGFSDVRLSSLTMASVPSLKSMKGLASLDSLKSISVFNCHNLTTIEHLENARYLQEAHLVSNENLNYCAIEPICRLINDLNENVTIENNDENCNDKELLESSCKTLSLSIVNDDSVLLYPNPTDKTLFFKNNNLYNRITIYNSVGNEIIYSINIKNGINVSDLVPGNYFAKLSSNGNEYMVIKFIKL